MAERLVFVYKSRNKQGRYLYLKEKDVFSHIPAGLLDAFGTPEFVMMFALSKHKTLPKVKVEDLEEALATKGYFLRIDIFFNSQKKRQIIVICLSQIGTI